MGIGPVVAELAGVSKHGGVKAGGHLRSNVRPGDNGQLINHLGDGACLGVNPVDVGEGLAAGVVVNIDEVATFQSMQTRALNPVAFQQDHRIVITLDARDLPDGRRAGQKAVDEGHAVTGDHLSALAQLLQNRSTGQHGADGIAIRARMGRDQKPLTALNRVQYCMDTVPFRHLFRSSRCPNPGAQVREADLGSSLSARLTPLLHPPQKLINPRLHLF